MNAATQNTPKSQNAPKLPIAISIARKYFVSKNPKVQFIDVTIELATDFTSGGNNSPKSAHGRGPNPRQYTITNKIKETIGSQLRLDAIENFSSSNKKNKPNKPRQIDIPPAEKRKIIFLPSRSTTNGVVAEAKT